MTTTTAGGKITGILALTCATDVALQVGDYVHLVGDYKVALADGSKPVLGRVSVRNVKRTSDVNSTSFPVAATPGGQVTVEVAGYAVDTVFAGATLAAGDQVGVGAAGAVLKYVDATTTPNVQKVGLALTGGNSGAKIDVLRK